MAWEKTRTYRDSSSISISNAYLDIAVGARVAVGENLWIGGNLSPEATSSGTFTNDLVSFTLGAGHGQRIELGIGALPSENLALEGSYTQEQGAEKAFSQGYSSFGASLGFAASEQLVLDAALAQTKYEQLDVDDDPYTPPGTGTAYLIGAFYQLDPDTDTVLGAELTRSSISYSDTGDFLFDLFREDSLTQLIITVSLSSQF